MTERPFLHLLLLLLLLLSRVSFSVAQFFSHVVSFLSSSSSPPPLFDVEIDFCCLRNRRLYLNVCVKKGRASRGTKFSRRKISYNF